MKSGVLRFPLTVIDVRRRQMCIHGLVLPISREMRIFWICGSTLRLGPSRFQTSRLPVSLEAMVLEPESTPEAKQLRRELKQTRMDNGASEERLLEAKVVPPPSTQGDGNPVTPQTTEQSDSESEEKYFTTLGDITLPKCSNCTEPQVMVMRHNGTDGNVVWGCPCSP